MTVQFGGSYIPELLVRAAEEEITGSVGKRAR